MPSISGNKKAAEPRQEKQNLIILNETNTSSGLTQMQNLTIDDFDLLFRVSTHTTLIYPDEKDNLYKVVLLDHQPNKTNTIQRVGPKL